MPRGDYERLSDWVERQCMEDDVECLRDVWDTFISERHRKYPGATPDGDERLYEFTVKPILESIGRRWREEMEAWVRANPEQAEAWGFRWRMLDILEYMPLAFFQGLSGSELAALFGVSRHYVENTAWLARRIGIPVPYRPW